jgi:hypothetical protein
MNQTFRREKGAESGCRRVIIRFIPISWFSECNADGGFSGYKCKMIGNIPWLYNPSALLILPAISQGQGICPVTAAVEFTCLFAKLICNKLLCDV